MKQDQPHGNKSDFSSEKPLQSWKEIAAYIEIGERTARRWEENSGLPVRRHSDGKRSSVYAYPSEIEAWRLAHKPNSSQAHLWQRGVPAIVGVLGIFLGGWFIFYGPVFNPPNPLVEAEGITLKQVLAGAGVEDWVDVSLDGRFLTFTDWDTGDLAIRDLDSEENRRVTNKGPWEESDEWAEIKIISPDGKKIVCVWYKEEGTYELRLLDLSESEAQVLYRCEEGEYIAPFDWSPDGKEILVGIRNSNEGKLAFLSVSDHTLRNLATKTSERIVFQGEVKISLAPDGKHLVYNDPKGPSGQRDVFIVPLSALSGNTLWDDLQSTNLTNHPADDYLPTWSPDGRRVFFVSDRTGSPGLWMVRVENGRRAGEPELIKADVGPLNNLIGCTQGGEIYFSLAAGIADIYLFEMDPQSGEVLRQPAKLVGRYVGANKGAAFSPDGRYVAYHFQHGPDLFGSGALWIVIRSLDTGEERVLRTRLLQCAPVQWFPDSKSLLIVAYRSETERIADYHRMDLESGQTELIRRGASSRSSKTRPDFSIDGESILFAELQKENNEWLFKSFEIKSGREEIIHRIPNGKSAWSFLLSPDGKEMAWAEQNNDTSSWSVCTKPVEGGVSKEHLKLESPAYLTQRASIVWMADGKHLLVSKFTGEGSQSELLRISLETGEVKTLGITMERILFGDVHKDGRLVAFWSGIPKGWAAEIWAMEGFLAENENSD